MFIGVIFILVLLGLSFLSLYKDEYQKATYYLCFAILMLLIFFLIERIMK